MVRRTKDEAEQTYAAILDAAENVFYKQGVARTSLEEIARVAGVTRGAVYWHFKDKIELCEAMMQRVFLPQEDLLEKLAARNTKTPLNDLHRACRDSLTGIAKDKRRQRVITVMMHRCEYVQDMVAIMKRRHKCKDHMLERLLTMLKRAAALKQLSPAWTAETAALGLQALMSGLISSALEGRKNYSLLKNGLPTLDAFFRSLSIS